MHRHPLIAALLSATFAFQLTLAGAGVTCTMPTGGTGSAGESGTAAMTAMGMADAAVTSSGGHSQAVTGDAHGTGVPCDQSASTTACQLMTACAVVFVATASDTPAASEQPAARIAPFRIGIFTSRSAAPELPPPRA